jgi:hypothetical protein
MDTARLLNLGPVEAEPTFGNVVVLTDQRESLIAGARTVIDQWAGSGILLVVTHGANIHALTGILVRSMAPLRRDLADERHREGTQRAPPAVPAWRQVDCAIDHQHRPGRCRHDCASR